MMRFVNSVVLAASAVAMAVAPTPSATADDQPNQQHCTNSVSSTRCIKTGDAEINSSIPAPPAGPWAMYGPFWGGN
jgi:hypothetical protein